MKERLQTRPALFNKGLALALAASVGFHVVAAWGAGFWHQTSTHPEPLHVISLRLLGERSSYGPKSVTGQNQNEPTAGKAAPSAKRAAALRRMPPPLGRTAAPVQKTLIIQKPAVQRIPPEPPQPAPYASISKSHIPSAETSPPLLVASRSSKRLGELTLFDGSPTGKPSPSQSSVLDKQSLVAKTELSENRDRASRLEVIRQRIQEALVYPRAARRFGWEGTARVRIVLAPDGQLSNFTLEFSSKIGLLDREVLAAVQRAAPYPYVEGPIAIPVVFDLRAP